MKVILSGLLIVILCSAVGADEGELFVYDDHGKRDPLWRLVSPTGVILNYETDFLITDLVLEGIMVGMDGDNLAIVNGRILRTNDTIGQFVAEKITEDVIILRKDKLKFELKLKKGE